MGQPPAIGANGPTPGAWNNAGRTEPRQEGSFSDWEAACNRRTALQTLPQVNVPKYCMEDAEHLFQERRGESWQAGVTGTGSMMGGQNYMSSYQALALETVNTPAGTFAGALHVREQRGSGYVRDVWYAPGVGMVKMSDGTSTAALAGYTIPGAVAQPGGGAAPLAFIPVTGLWWNPNESGTGYNIQVQRGVMVVAMYSYVAAGDSLWYSDNEHQFSRPGAKSQRAAASTSRSPMTRRSPPLKRSQWTTPSLGSTRLRSRT